MFRIKLKELREARGISQQELADDIGVSPSAVGMWESGRREPRTLEQLGKIANYFGVSADYLLGQKEQEKPTPVAEGGLTAEFIRLYEQLSDEEKAFVVKQMKGLLTED